MGLKGNKLYSVFRGKCPRCHHGDMYKVRNPYVLNRIFEMHKTCSECGQRYKIEPSFFFGAMYTSYGIGVAIGVAVFIVSKVFLGFDLMPTFLGITLILLVLYPVIARLGRNVWINFFIQYKRPGNQKTSRE